MRKLLLSLVTVMAFVFAASAQNRTVTGKVADASGKPIPNASVIVKGSTSGTTSNNEGFFTLSVSDKAKTLVITAVGYNGYSVNIAGKSNIDVTLTATDNKLEEVVVVGYGVKNVREVTGSVSKVDGGKIANEPVTSFNQGLAGKTAGVQVNLASGVLADRTSIRVRGINSISNSSQPLIVVDGIPQINTFNLNGFNSGNGNRFDPLSLINSADIESIEILKDAGASVLYGSRAANGVVLITTKKGKKGTMKVSFDTRTGWSQVIKQPELLNGDQFIAIQNEKAGNRFTGANAIYATPAKESDVNGDGVNDRTNWNSLLYRQAMMYDNSVSFSGGADKLSVYGSFRYLNQEGVVLQNKLRSGQARLNLDITPKTWFKAGINIAYVRTLANGILTDNYIAGTTISGWQAPPTLSAYNPANVTGYNLTSAGLLSNGANTPTGPGGTNLLPSTAYYYNVLAALKLNRNDNTATDTKVGFYGELQPIKGLKINSKFSMQYQSNFEDQFTSPYIAGLGVPYNGLVQDQTQNWSNWVWSNFISYDKNIARKHKVGIVAGTEYQKGRYDYIYTGANNFSDPFFTSIIDGSYTNTLPGSTTILNLTGGNKSVNALISYFGRLNYAFNGRYFAEFGFRRDGFSGFGADNQFGNFPSVSLGWEVTKEKFMSDIKWLDYLKIRGSYGTVGNSRGIGDFASRTLYSGASYTSLTGLGISQQGNSNLQWESSKKINVGFEANFFKSRVNIVFDYFKNNIDKLVLNAPTLYTVGTPGSSIAYNIGGMYNKGYEITLNTTPVIKRDFTWTSSFNYTNIANKVTGLVSSNGNADITSGVQVASVGRALGTYKLPKWAGVDPNTGNPMWYAGNGSLKIWDFATQTYKDDKGNTVGAVTDANGDYQYLDKTGLPKWYGGWDNSFKYKQVDLSVSVIYSGGNYIYNTSKAGMLTNFFSNNFADILNRWTPTNKNTDIPKLWQNDNTANQSSTRFLEKGDFARIRTITLGYTFPKTMLNKWGMENIRFYIQSFNPFTFTKYSGLDPDVNLTNSTINTNIQVGNDSRATPQVRTMSVGLNVTF